MTHDEHADLSVNWFQLLERCDHKHGRLSHTTLSLADDVHAQYGLRDALILHCIGIKNINRAF